SGYECALSRLPARRRPGLRPGWRIRAPSRDLGTYLFSLTDPDPDVMTATPVNHPARKRLLLIAAAVFIVLAVLYAIWWALFGSHVESTDDAYVHGNLVQITPQV